MDSLPSTPSYYVTGDHSRDVYSLLKERFGEEAWQDHILMEAIQYLMRCKSKGQMRQDLQKAIVCIQRILSELPQGREE
jgi:hypothetical protein